VNKAIRRSGGKRNFWEIFYYLPRETRGYVPAFIAATYTMKYYPEHLLSPAAIQLPLHRDTIRLHEPVHLKQISEVLGIPLAQLRDLNPQYRADIVPSTDRIAYGVMIPGERIADFIDLQDSILAYKDSLFFDPGKQVASPSRYTASYRVDLPPDKYDRLSYTVQAGDNLGYIADWYDVRASDLRYWNNISRNLIRTGQKLVIYKPKGSGARYEKLNSMSFAEKQAFAGRAAPAAVSTGSSAVSSPAVTSVAGGADSDYITYTVRAGDTLWEIARKFPGVTETDIARLNGISNASKIKPGQVIRIRQKG
jgi:membrane-bound lytic murein transglycosylase D